MPARLPAAPPRHADRVEQLAVQLQAIRSELVRETAIPVSRLGGIMGAVVDLLALRDYLRERGL